MLPAPHEPSGLVFDTSLANSLLPPWGLRASLGTLTKTGLFHEELCSLLKTKNVCQVGSFVGNLERSRHSKGRAAASINVRSWPIV